MKYMRGSLHERLFSRLIPCPDPGCECLLWPGFTNNRGYGRIRIGVGTQGYVHRLAWELQKGPIPDGLTIDHVKSRGCRHRHCANIAHLEPVTVRENAMRGNTVIAINAAKAHCPRGHPYDAANTLFTRRGARYCRACKREWNRRQRARRRVKNLVEAVLASST